MNCVLQYENYIPIVGFMGDEKDNELFKLKSLLKRLCKFNDITSILKHKKEEKQYMRNSSSKIDQY